LIAIIISHPYLYVESPIPVFKFHRSEFLRQAETHTVLAREALYRDTGGLEFARVWRFDLPEGGDEDGKGTMRRRTSGCCEAIDGSCDAALMLDSMVRDERWVGRFCP
jgi:hypothetical protein